MSGDSVSCVSRPAEGGSVTVVEFFCGDGGEVVDGFVGALGVVPAHPFQGGGFDLVQGLAGVLRRG